MKSSPLSKKHYQVKNKDMKEPELTHKEMSSRGGKNKWKKKSKKERGEIMKKVREGKLKKK